MVNDSSVGTFTVEEISDSAEFCLEGSSVAFVYSEGTYTSENTYSIIDEDGNVLAEGTPAEGSACIYMLMLELIVTTLTQQ